MSNFDFLKEYDYDLWNWGEKLEHELIISPSSVVTNATRFLERVLELLIDETGTEVDQAKEYYYRLDAVYREGHIKYGFKQSIYGAYELRNKIHNTNSREIEKTEIPMAKQLHKKLFYIGKKLYTDFFNKENLIPAFVPVEVDTSTDELDIIDIPEFQEVIDNDYDFCIICGKPNHASSSLCCDDCNRVMDNANTFISVRNHFGKNEELTKEKLIKFGIPEGYLNQFINSMARENMFKVTGSKIYFNNFGLDNYLSKIDNYINICELITKFRQDKILAKDIKQTREYKEGSHKNEPFHQFYTITNREIIKKFERDILTTEDIWKSIEYTTITEKQLTKWYNRYNRGNVKDAFIIFNDLLKREYLDLRREGVSENNIKVKLNVTKKIYNFWKKYDPEFSDNLNDITIELISRGISEKMTRDEIIEFAGVSKKEYDNLIKVADFNNTPLAELRNKEIESRKESFIKYLKNNDLKSSCHLAKFTLDDFYEYYDDADFDSQFRTESTRILMDKFLAQRRLGKTREEATEFIGIKKLYVDRWLSRSMYADFKNEELKITVNLILRGFKKNKTLDEIAEVSGVSVDRIETYLRLGARGEELYKELYEYYEENLIPQKLEKFLDAKKTKSIRKSLELAHLKQGELDKYYELGKNGDERYAEFYEECYNLKKGTYVYFIHKDKTHDIAMRESQLSEEEYLESKDEFEDMVRKLKFTIVFDALRDKKLSNVIAKMAGCSVDELYDWYFRGRDGDEDYVDFYEIFHKTYVNASVVPMQRKIDDENASIETLIRSNKDKFTRKDVEIWIEHGLIKPKVNLDAKKEDKDDDEEDESKNTVKKVNLGKFTQPVDNRSTLGRVSNNYDEEYLKRQILKK